MTVQYMWEGQERSHGSLALLKPPSELSLSSCANVAGRHLTATCASNDLPYTNESQISPASSLEFQKHRVNALLEMSPQLDGRHCGLTRPEIIPPLALLEASILADDNPVMPDAHESLLKNRTVSVTLKMNEHNLQ